MKDRTTEANSRGRESSRTSPQERAAAESTPSRQRQQECETGGVCCDEQLIGAERFARKGDDDDIE